MKTIASIKDISGMIDVSRIGGDGGYCISYGKNVDGSEYTISQRSVPVSSGELTTGVMNVDLYKKTAEIVTGDGSTEEKLKALEELGINEDSAMSMLTDYASWLDRTEIAGENNIQEGIASVGHVVERNYGYYDITNGWKVDGVYLEGGSGHMNTIYSWGTLKSSGIVTDIATTTIN